jgi:hypothetical protein
VEVTSYRSPLQIPLAALDLRTRGLENSHGGGDRRARCAAEMAKRAVEVWLSGGRRRLPGGPLWAARLRSQLGWQNEMPPLEMK